MARTSGSVNGNGNDNGSRNIPVVGPRLQIKHQNSFSSGLETESESDSIWSESVDESGSELDETDSLIVTHLTYCPICCESLHPPVYQCQNGHIACGPCCTEMANKCPSRHCSIGTSRCRFLEKVIESFEVACRNRLYGCVEIFSRNKKLDKHNHEKICCYSPCSCPYNNCPYIGISESLYKHFAGVHYPSPISFGVTKLISLGASQTPVFFQDDSKSTLFILEPTIKSHVCYVSVTFVGHPGLAAFSYCLKAVIDNRTSVEIEADVVLVRKWSAGCILGKCLLLPINMVNERGMLTLELVIRSEVTE